MKAAHTFTKGKVRNHISAQSNLRSNNAGRCKYDLKWDDLKGITI